MRDDAVDGAWLTRLDPFLSHVHIAQPDGTPVDTGFLVFNELTYPNLLGFFEVRLLACLPDQDGDPEYRRVLPTISAGIL